MVPVIEAWTQESFQRGEAQGEIKGELKGEIKGERKGEIKGEITGEMRAKIEMIEGFLKANVSWETITQATQINQKLYQSMKALYANVVSAITPEIVTEIDLDAEYVTKRRAMVVKILDHRFQLSDEQQTALLERLTVLNRREPLDGLVNSALIVEDMGLFEDELAD